MKTPAIVWAIDPNQSNPKIWNQSQALAQNVSRSFQYNLQPVFIADRGLLSGSTQTAVSDVPRAVARSQTQLEKLLKPLKSKKILHPQVLFFNDYNTQAEARFMNERAVDTGTPLVIAATNARRGLRRYLDGSFSETLVKFSKAPVLLVNPKARVSRNVKNILFATDFSSASAVAFKKVCETARASGAKLEVLSVLSDPLYWSDMGTPMTIGAQAYIHSDYFKEDIRNSRRRGAAMVKAAQKLGVEASFSLDEKISPSISKAIRRHAERGKADIIAIAARGDTSKVHFFGSTAQELIRESEVPIWIYHSPDASPPARSDESGAPK